MSFWISRYVIAYICFPCTTHPTSAGLRFLRRDALQTPSLSHTRGGWIWKSATLRAAQLRIAPVQILATIPHLLYTTLIV
jgi:hypothetical protein